MENDFIPAKGSARTYTHLLHLLGASAVLLLVFLYLYGPALALPPALIDEVVYIDNYEKVWRNWWEKGFTETVRNDLWTRVRGYKAGAAILYALVFWAVDTDRAAMHAILLLLLAATSAGMVAAVCLEWKRVRPGEPVGAPIIWIGAGAALLMMGGEVPGWHNLQALRVNWYRLHTKEAIIAGMLAVQMVCFIQGLRATGTRTQAMYFAIALAAVLLAGSTKLTAMAQLGPFLAMAVALWLSRHPAWKALAVTSAIATAVAILYAAWLRGLTPSDGQTYFSDYQLTPGRVRNSWKFYREAFHDILGPLGIILLPAVAVRVCFQLREKRSWRHLLQQNLVLIFCGLSWAAALATALPWAHLLPRYLLPSYLLLCMLIGLEAAMQFDWLAEKGRSRGYGLLVAAGALSILVMPLRILALGLAVLAGLAFWRRQPGWTQAPLAGIAAVGLAYFAVFAWIGRGSIVGDYVQFEKASYRMVTYLAGQFKEGKKLGFRGDTGDERIYAMAYYARPKPEEWPEIKSVRSPADLQGLDLVLLEEPQGRRMDLPPQLQGARRVEFFGSASIKRPISFWKWRRLLWDGKLVMPSEPASLPLGWTVIHLQ